MTIYIISEDSSTHSFQVLKNIIVKSLRVLEPSIEIDKIDFRDRLNNRPAIKGAKWKEKKDKKFREFMMELMNELNKHETYAFWHIDGDTTWADFPKSLNYKTFHEKIKIIPHIVPTPKGNVDVDFSRLFLLFPCYSIESWLLPFLDKIQCDEIEKFTLSGTEIDQWDEIEQIKDVCGISSQWNKQLSEKFKHETIYNSGKSYYNSFNEIENHQDFKESLKKILPPWAEY